MYPAGGAWALGIGLPRSSWGQAPIFWISLAQLFRYSFELLQFQLGEKEKEAVEWGWGHPLKGPCQEEKLILSKKKLFS